MDTNSVRQNVSRWVRVGFFTVTTLGPVINVISSRLRDRAKTVQAKSRKRGSDLTTTLTQQGGKLSQVVTERSSDLARDLVGRGSKATQVVTERGSDLARDLTERGNRATREVSARTQRTAQQAQRELARRGRQVRQRAGELDDTTRFWSVFGFSLGLTSTIVALYLLLRRRTQQDKQTNESIQLPSNQSLNGSTRTTGTTNTANNSMTATSAPSTTTSAPSTQNNTTSTTSGAREQSNAATLGTTENVYQTVETPGSTAKDYTPGSEASAIATGMPTVSVNDTDIPAESLGTASGFTGDTGPPNVAGQQNIVSNALPPNADFSNSSQDVRTMVEQVLAQESNRDTSPATGPALLGVVVTKRYYPIETPLSQIRAVEGGELDVIYFSNESEAHSQGYSAAE